MKRPILASIAWIVILFCVSFFALWYSWEYGGSRSGFEKRAEMLGSGTGMIGGIGLAAIWGVWYLKNQKKAPIKRR